MHCSGESRSPGGENRRSRAPTSQFVTESNQNDSVDRRVKIPRNNRIHSNVTRPGIFRIISINIGDVCQDIYPTSLLSTPLDNSVSELDGIDRRLLSHIGRGFPLEPRPFLAIGKALSLEEDDVMERVRRLMDEGFISRIGVIIDPRKAGFTTTLVAASVPREMLDEVVSWLNASPAVTHNYLREHEYNLWFTLVAPDRDAITGLLGELSGRFGISPVEMPMTKRFKIGVSLDIQ